MNNVQKNIQNISNFSSPLGVRGNLSKHNIITPIADSDEFFIVNPLYNAADIISTEELTALESGIDDNGEFAERGYLTDETKEKRAFKLAYLDFTEKREDDETQLFFVPNYKTK